MVLPFEKSKNLVQEERLEIRCKALGYPQPTIYWFKEDVPIPVSACFSFCICTLQNYGEILI